MRRWAAVLAAAAVAIGACGDDDAPATGPPADDPSETADEPPEATDDPADPGVEPFDPARVAARPSAGCDGAPVPESGQSRVDLTSGGEERWYLRHVPGGYDGATPAPVVISVHGYLEGAAIHAQQSAFDATADAEGFVAIFPHGRGVVPMWDPVSDTGDLDFVTDLLDDLEATLCVDTARIYVAGLSNGAMMTSAIACEHAERVAAVAPVAGVQVHEACDPARPVPVVTFHGTDDDYVAFDGGLGPAAQGLPAPDGEGTIADSPGGPIDEFDTRSVPELLAGWAERNGCGTGTTETDVADDVVHVVHECPPDASVELYRIEGGGHSWPGSAFSAGIEDVVGATTFSIDANSVMWEFFAQHPLPAG